MEYNNKTVAFYTLGCKVNQYESEALRERMAEKGFRCVDGDEPASVSIINTCTVTGLSDKKSRQLIRRARKNNPEGVVAVIGCYSQIKPEQVSSMQEVDIVLGSREKSRLPDMICDYISNRTAADGIGMATGDMGRSADDHADKTANSASGTAGDVSDGVNSTACGFIADGGHIRQTDKGSETFDDLGPVSNMASRSRALIKIQDGCDRYCAYCVIPIARGPVRSRASEDILRETERLISAGYKELVITGINLALYGKDRRELNLLELLKRITSVDGDFRVRLGSLEPTVVDAEFMRRLIQFDKLCPSLHLSVQSGSDRILGRMGRNYSRQEYLELISILRDKDPAFGVSTDFIVGFPGENEEDFLLSLSLTEEVKFHHIHVFQFSGRPGTAAAAMEGQIPSQVKAERSKRLIKAGETSADSFLRRNVGHVKTVIPEKWDEPSGYLSGYSENNLRVNFAGAEDKIGRFAEVDITGTHKSGLSGRIRI